MNDASAEIRARHMFFVGLAAWTATHLIWVFWDYVHHDEFLLLARARDTYLAGSIQAGGRPGLGTLTLIPFVRHCSDAVDSIRIARIAWTAFGAIALVAFWKTLGQLFSDRRTRIRDATIGVALLALTPAFLRHSVQIRTDQPAIALGLVGASIVLMSRRVTGWALLAGISFGAGYLYSQKLLYVGLLSFILAVGDLAISRDFSLRREATRVLLVVFGFVGAIAAYRTVAGLFFQVPPALHLQGQLADFAIYEHYFGYSAYQKFLIVESLPMALLGALGIAATLRFRLLSDADGRPSLLLAWTIAVAGLAVTWFHAGRFPYFWMTLGLFPGTACACALPAIRTVCLDKKVGRLTWRTAFSILIVFAALEVLYPAGDTQEVQRDSLRFIEENFDEAARGFHPERAILCRSDPEHFPTFVIQSIVHRFETGDAPADNRAAFVTEFEDRPVRFVIDSYLLDWYPEEIQEFWSARYALFSPTVYVPGAQVSLQPGEAVQFDVVAEGDYQWWPAADSPSRMLLVGARSLATREVIHLQVGSQLLSAAEGGVQGLFALRLPETPSPRPAEFYTGYRPFWMRIGASIFH